MTADRLDLDALKALEAAATEGPWETNQAADEESTTWIEHALGDVLNHDERGHGHMRENFAWMRRADAALIVALRNAAPALIAAALRAEQAKSNRDTFRAAFEQVEPRILAAEADRDAAQAALARVEALHQVMPVYLIDSVNGYDVYEDGKRKQIAALCRECTADFLVEDAENGEWGEDMDGSVRWPCDTIRAVAGEGPEAGD